jgi:hypothetical protein
MDIGRRGIFEQILANAQSAASSLRVKSALNPMLWLCAIVSLPCFILSYFLQGEEPLAIALVFIGAAPIAARILGFLYLIIFAPEKLQSEEYQIRHETLELIRQKGESVTLEPSSLEAIANPIHAAITRGGDQ